MFTCLYSSVVPDGRTDHSAFRVEETTLTSLKPNTRYEYDVMPGSEEGKGSFKTPPFGPAGPFTFFVYGDNRTRPDVHRKVMAEVAKHGIPDFILQTGDMVANGEDSAQWPEFFDIERNLLRQTSFFPALGNHERNTLIFRNSSSSPAGTIPSIGVTPISWSLTATS